LLDCPILWLEIGFSKENSMVPVNIDHSSAVSVRDQLVARLSEAVKSGELEAGTRLPPSRQLADELGLNRNTVAAAYAELGRLGLVRSRVGAGTFVGASESDAADMPAVAPAMPWERLLARRCSRDNGVGEQLGMGERFEGAINFETAIPSPEFYPAHDFRLCLERAWNLDEKDPLSYGPAAGYLPLRRWLAERYAGRGMAVDPENIVITSGSQQGLDLVGKLLLEPDDLVLMGAPGYPNACSSFQLFDATILSLAVDDHGLVTGRLPGIAGADRAKFLYVMSNHQNPTGASLPVERRIELLRWSREARVPLVEDDFNAGLVYRGEEPVPLRGMAGGENVILLGTFSKVLFPGVRLGWMVLPDEVREQVGRLRAWTDLGTPVILQQAMLEFCRSGHLDRHLEMMRKVNRGRLERLLVALEEHFPKQASWTRPDGGMSVWVTLPEGTDVLRIHRESRDAGVRFAPGVLFYPGRGGENAFRLTFIRESEERINQGVATLGKIVRKHLRRKSEPVDERKTKDVWI
jgi:GntR family transcriptional regulator/MocR family aminotransferase